MKGKKLMAMLMAGSLLLAGLTGCGGANAKGGGAAASADDYPNGPVTIICRHSVMPCACFMPSMSRSKCSCACLSMSAR